MAGRRRNRMSLTQLDLLPMTLAGGGGGRGGFGTSVAAGGEGRRRSFASRVLALTGVPLDQIKEGKPGDVLTSHILLFDPETDTRIVYVGYPYTDEDGNEFWPPEALRKVTLKANPRKKKPSLTPRSSVAMAHSLRGGAGAGKHHTRTRDVETGRSRKPKHGGKRALSEMRENPLEAYRKQSLDGEVYFSVPFANHTATLDVQFSETDWSRPGAPKTLRVLRTSHMAQRPQHGDLGHYGTLVRRLADAGPLTSDDLLNAAISAEEAAERMFTSYPQYRYRDAAHYYEGLAEVLTDLASSLQAGWRTNGKRRKMYLFSYGSNSPRQLAERLGHPVKGRAAFVSGHLRAFRGWSNRWEGGVATLIPGRGNTYGYVAEVTPEDLAILDRYEGVATGNYRRATLTVTTSDGEAVPAVVYLASSTEKNAPSRAYKRAVAETIGAFWEGENGPVTEADITVRNPLRRGRR